MIIFRNKSPLIEQHHLFLHGQLFLNAMNGDCWGVWDIRVLNGNRKNITEIIYSIKILMKMEVDLYSFLQILFEDNKQFPGNLYILVQYPLTTHYLLTRHLISLAFFKLICCHNISITEFYKWYYWNGLYLPKLSWKSIINELCGLLTCLHWAFKHCSRHWYIYVKLPKIYSLKEFKLLLEDKKV